MYNMLYKFHLVLPLIWEGEGGRAICPEEYEN